MSTILAALMLLKKTKMKNPCQHFIFEEQKTLRDSQLATNCYFALTQTC